MMRPFRCLFDDGAERDVMAADRDDAEKRARYEADGCDHGEAWSVIDLDEFPDPEPDSEFPDYPCPEDPAGLHFVGCGCDF